MGEVYRARDTTLGRDVAIKVLPAAFADEIRKLSIVLGFSDDLVKKTSAAR